MTIKFRLGKPIWDPIPVMTLELQIITMVNWNNPNSINNTVLFYWQDELGSLLLFRTRAPCTCKEIPFKLKVRLVNAGKREWGKSLVKCIYFRMTFYRNGWVTAHTCCHWHCSIFRVIKKKNPEGSGVTVVSRSEVEVRMSNQGKFRRRANEG